MKSSFKIFGFLLFLPAIFFSCKKQDYYQANPNVPSVATPALLFTNVCESIFNPGRTTLSNAAYTTRFLTYYESPSSSVQYNWTSAGFGNYDVLRQVENMDELATTTGQPNYIALGHFFRAVLFSQLTETFGDVPYSEALQALQGNTKPKYDAQEDIYAGILQELDQANNDLDETKGQLDGDIIYGNTSDPILQWQKLINAFRLRLLIHLSKKESDTKLNITQQFQTIVGNPAKYPLMESDDDNGQLVYNNSQPSNNYPSYQSLDFQTAVSLEKGFVDSLISKNDPRLYVFAEPLPNQPAGVITSYAGLDAGLGISDQQSQSAAASRIKKRYWNDAINEPYIFLSYAEQEFLIAEAITRGWITAGPNGETAADCYNTGITASMQFYDTYASAGISDADIANYLAQPNVAFNTSDALTEILTQKYIAFFLNSGWEPFYEQRRTGIPTFDVGPATGNGGMVPKRWLYPANEYSLNSDNVNAAVQSQYGGTDDINGEMWLLK